MRQAFAVAAAATLFGSLPAAHAAQISGLVDTGAGLAGGTIDTNYSFSSIDGTATGTACSSGKCGVAATSGIPGSWLADTATSHWLTPTSNVTQSYDPSSAGHYAWTLTFDLTGYDSATASFSARWAADNGGTVELNGHELSGAASPIPKGHTLWTSFSADAASNWNSYFNPGVNSLAFLATNAAQTSGNPTGLRVEFASSSVNSVPEPGIWAKMLAGLGLMGFVSYRRK